MQKTLCKTLADATSVNPTNKWEKIKQKIPSSTKAFTRCKSNDKRIAISQLLEVIHEYQCKMPLNKKDADLYTVSLEDLECLQTEYIKGGNFLE